MAYNFDEIIERRSSGCFKWNQYEGDVIPMFVADMDFRVSNSITEALQARVKHGIFGYEGACTELLELICQRLKSLYDWSILPEEIVLLPGLRAGLNLACRTLSAPGTAAITLTPIYPPFLAAPINHAMSSQFAPLKATTSGPIMRYEIDFDALNASITKETRLLNFCNPHNPTGRAFTTEELQQVGDICTKHNLVICSDEIFCDLIMGNLQHKPFACVSPEIGDRCITLMSPSKTFNISGLGAAYAIIQNAELRKLYKKQVAAVNAEITTPGMVAFMAAYQDGEQWLRELLVYLRENRNTYVNYVLKNFPRIKTTVPEATYLAWLDCRDMGIEGNPYEFFLKHARVALNDGQQFGVESHGFVRFNFACPRSQMIGALEQMKSALEKLAPIQS